MKAIFRPDQEAVMEFLDTRQRAAVFSNTGSGKTLMAATHMHTAMYDRFALGRLLIVAPKLVARDGWGQQLRQWDHLREMAGDMRLLTSADFDLTPSVVSGGGRGALTFRDKAATKKHLLGLKERTHIISWDFWPHLVKACGANFPYQGIVFDESSFLRDQGSDRTKAARQVVHNLGVVDWQLQLSATPSANHGDAIFPQINLLAPGLLGSTLTEFRDTWCVPASRNWQSGIVYSYKINPALQDALNTEVAKVAISVPGYLHTPLIEVVQGVDANSAQQTAYDDLERDHIWRSVSCGSEAVLHGKLRQVACGFAYDDDEKVLQLSDAKIDRLREIVDSINGPVLVAFQFKEELRRLREAFGKDVMDLRDTGAKAKFEAGKLRVLAVHPASGGHGVDGLQKVSSQLIWMSVPEDLELKLQLNGRLHRFGTQADTVFAHYLVARGTVEEQIFNGTLPDKAARMDRFLSGVRVSV